MNELLFKKSEVTVVEIDDFEIKESLQKEGKKKPEGDFCDLCDNRPFLLKIDAKIHHKVMHEKDNPEYNEDSFEQLGKRIPQVLKRKSPAIYKGVSVWLLINLYTIFSVVVWIVCFKLWIFTSLS
eukprot:TRINITY_DN13960_c0_g1_i1.p1 TRINITY_DN13960_c0_g1~~TRINITY_DN13960_c0_g1_i1.p1  ORF type:complete len:125 (-),score=26.52 TRINITY_DN13960_c0_g1_i1:31-405(-)